MRVNKREWKGSVGNIYLTLRLLQFCQPPVVWLSTCSASVRWCSRSFPISGSPHASKYLLPLDPCRCMCWTLFGSPCADGRDTPLTYYTDPTLKEKEKSELMPSNWWKWQKVTFGRCIIRDRRGSFGLMTFLLTLIAGRMECGILDDVIAVAAQRTGRRSLHVQASGPWWRRWHIGGPIIQRHFAAIPPIGHRTTG